MTWSVCVKVVFDKMHGELNETVVYTNDAIRPVCLASIRAERDAQQSMSELGYSV